MFGRYDTCQTVNKPVRDAVYYRLKSIQRRAVRPGLVSPDWETNLYFCGVVNKYQNNHSHEAALGVIHKRLLAGLRRVKRSNRITYLSLILLETCMKNCGTRFHYVAADEALFKTLLRLARPRISGKRMFGVSSSGNYMRDLMEERVLLLIQAWGKAFSDRTNGRMSLYTHHYSQLRSKGVRFPPERPEDEVFSKQEKEAQGRSSRNTQMDEEEVKSILNPLKESMDVLEEMLNSLGPRDNPEKDPVIQSLVSLCKEAKPRVIKLIDKCVDNEHLTEFLMNTFDRLEELLSQHEIKCGRTTGARPLKYETSRPPREGGAPRSGKSSSKSSRGKQDDSDYSSDDSDDDDGEENYDDESDDDDYLRGSNKGGNVPKEKKGSFGTLSRKRSTSLPPRVQQNPTSPSQQQLQQHYQQHQQQQQQQRATQNMSAPFAPVAYQQPLYGATPQPQAVPGAQDDYQQQQLQLQQQMQRLQIQQQQQQQQLQQALAQSPASPLSPRGTGGYTAGQFAGQPGSQGQQQPQRVMDVGRMSTDDFNRLAAQGFKTMDPAAGHAGQPSPMSPFSASAPSIPYAGPISPPHSAGSQPHPQQQQQQLQQQQQYALYQQQLAQQQHLQQQQLLQQQQQLWGQQQPGSQGQQWQPQTLAQPSSSHGSFSLIDSDLDFLASVGSGKGQMPQQYQYQQQQQQHSLGGLKSNLTSSLPTLPSMDHHQQQHAPYGGPGAYQRSASVASGLPPPPAAHRSRTNSRNGQAY